MMERKGRAENLDKQQVENVKIKYLLRGRAGQCHYVLVGNRHWLLRLPRVINGQGNCCLSRVASMEQ